MGSRLGLGLEQRLCNGRVSVHSSVRLSHRSTAAMATGGFAAERRRLQQISIGSRRSISSKFGQRRVESLWRRLETDVLRTEMVSG